MSRPESTPSLKNPNKMPSWLMKTTTGLALAGAAFGLAGCSDGPVNAAPGHSETTATSVPNPGESNTTTQVEARPTTPAELVNVKEIPTSILELGTYQLLSPEKQAVMQSLYAMDKMAFREQPNEAQVSFCMQILDNLRPIVDYQLKLNNITDLIFTENPTTAQQIEDNDRYISIAASRLITRGDGEYKFDSELAYKMASCGQDTKITDEGLWDQIYGQATAAGWSFESMNNEFKATVTSESTAADGTVTATIEDQGQTATKKYRQVSYPRMSDGTPSTLYVTIAALQTS